MTEEPHFLYSKSDGVARLILNRPARHNAVSLVETVLRKSFFKRLFFNTPIFGACLYGAKVYYRLWTALCARAHWNRILRHPVYGPQWRDGWKGVDR